MGRIKRHPMLGIAVMCVSIVLATSAAFAAPKLVQYFTRGAVPTATELAEIAKLNAVAVQPWTIRVINGSKVTRVTPTAPDYVAGYPPAVYRRDAGIDNATTYPFVDPDKPPAPYWLPGAEIVIYSGQVVALPGGGSATFTVSGNTITALVHVPIDGGT